MYQLHGAWTGIASRGPARVRCPLMGGFYRVLATRGQVRFEPHGAWEAISITTPAVGSVCVSNPISYLLSVMVTPYVEGMPPRRHSPP